MKYSKSNPDYRPYNGHPNWQLWNVTMWLCNDEELYRYATGLIEQYGLRSATAHLSEELQGQSTPDGARYSKAAIRYAMRDLI